MKQQQINQALEQFSTHLDQAGQQQMTLSLRANLLHEAKKLEETLQSLITAEQKAAREQFFMNALEHFIACARLERADMLQASCKAMQGEVARMKNIDASINSTAWNNIPVQDLAHIA
ncbi:MAG: hypothetical protein CMI12_03210 [Oceanospirillum sp.]|nr:hypothetical protein [Oceanospirillum sp.]